MIYAQDMHEPGSSGVVWREGESVPAGCTGERSEGWEHVRNEECVSDGGCQEEGELWLWNRRARHAAEGKQEKWKTKAQIVTRLTLALSLSLVLSGMHGSTRQEEVIDHRLTDREWAEEWKHLDHVRKVITFFITIQSVCVWEREWERIQHEKCVC